MNVAAKRRVIAAGLVVFALWPLVHRVLVLRYDISPWRFFGWAMYCQPKFAPEVAIYVRRGAERIPLIEAAGEPSELQRRRRDYVRRREMWGGLLAPDNLGREALRAAGDADVVEIIVRRLVIEPATSRLTAREETYTYPAAPPSSG